MSSAMDVDSQAGHGSQAAPSAPQPRQPPPQIVLHPLQEEQSAMLSSRTVPTSLRDFSDQGLQQLHDVTAAVKRLFAASQQTPLSPEELGQVKERYLAGTTALRETLKQCHQLHEEQQRMQVAAESVSGTDDASQAQVAALQARVHALRQVLEARNERMKGLINELRSMLSSIGLWDAYKRQLDLHKQATE